MKKKNIAVLVIAVLLFISSGSLMTDFEAHTVGFVLGWFFGDLLMSWVLVTAAILVYKGIKKGVSKARAVVSQ